MQRHSIRFSLAVLMVLGLLAPMATAKAPKRTPKGIFTQTLPKAPAGWTRDANPPYQPTLNYRWSAKDARKSDVRFNLHLYQHAFQPDTYDYKKEVFAVRGKEQIAKLDKKAAEKNAYFMGDSVAGPWKMRTYVLRDTGNIVNSAYDKQLVWVVLYRPGQEAWLEVGLSTKCPSFPPNSPVDWFDAIAVQNAAARQKNWSASPKTWTPAKAPRWDAHRAKALKAGAEQRALLAGNLKTVSAQYDQAETLFLEVLQTFLKSQGISARLNASYFRNPDPMPYLNWYYWPKSVSLPARPSSAFAKSATTPPKKPAPQDPPAPKPVTQKPVTKEPELPMPPLKTPPPKPTIQTNLNTARVALDAQQWNKTIEASDRVLAVEPKNSAALWLKGLALVGQKRYGPAADLFEIVAKQKPDNKDVTNYAVEARRLANEQKKTTDALIAKASDALDQEQYDSAITSCKKALEISPANLKARWYLGLAMVGQEKFKEALVELEAVAKNAPDNAKIQAFVKKIRAVAAEKK